MISFSLENRVLRFAIMQSENEWGLEDLRAGVRWGNRKGAPWLHQLQDGQSIPLIVREVKEVQDGLQARFSLPSGADAGLALIFRLSADALMTYWQPDSPACLPVELFTAGLETTAAEAGQALIPMRMGLMIPAGGPSSFDTLLGTYEYEGVHMAMAGLFKSGAVLLTDWQDPSTSLHLRREVGDDAGSCLRLSFQLRKTARSVELRPLGLGGLHELALAYRQRTTDLGYRVTWSEKLKTRPQAERLFGTCNFKLWTALARSIDENLAEKSVVVHWTFDEVAQIAEHLRGDLQLEDVLFHLGGWTTYGYDCRHPDILPANPECGGNDSLVDCSERVKASGYLFCLHDNYQDMYRDAPSWGEEWLQKNADGSPTVGGVWLGGRAYYTCAREALRLAQRPQNLPLVKELINPDLYFIDTTYAVGPQECFDPRHPLTKQDDIHWKAELSDYTRDVIGMFGSECGREWAVPHADFFEGLTSVSGHYFHFFKPEEVDARVVPFFDMIFHDCIALYGKYGYEPSEMAEQVIHHAAMGRTLYYHSLGSHLYWQDDAGQIELPLPSGKADPALYTRAHNGWAEDFCLWDRFMKNTQELLGPFNKRTSQVLLEQYEFLDPARSVRRSTFSNGAWVVVNGSSENYVFQSERWGRVVLPPFGLLAETADFAALVVSEWNGQVYDSPTLFTLTSLDLRPLEQSRRVRVYHGFGPALLVWRGRTVEVKREEII